MLFFLPSLKRVLEKKGKVFLPGLRASLKNVRGKRDGNDIVMTSTGDPERFECPYTLLLLRKRSEMLYALGRLF